MRQELRTLTDEQRRTNALLTEILASRREHDADRESEFNLVKTNTHLSHGAVMLAAVSVAVGIIALINGLPSSRFTLLAVICAGTATIVLLVLAAVQLVLGWDAARRADAKARKRH
jgi:hypothetical protein